VAQRPSVLVIDNFDSFVYNLVQYCEELGAAVTVRRSDEVTVADVAAGNFDGVLVSPGPGHPRDTPEVLEIIRYCGDHNIELFGVCLGHQALAEAFGYDVVRAPALFHGRASSISHSGEGVFHGVSSPIVVGRYHSLVVDPTTLGTEFVVTASAGDLIMAMRHATKPLEGVQFHPESVLTQAGYTLVANWLVRLGATDALAIAAALTPGAEARRAALPSPSA